MSRIMAGARNAAVKQCEENFQQRYPSIDKKKTIMCPADFLFHYKAPTDEKASGYLKEVFHQGRKDKFRGDNAEKLVFDALNESREPMFVISGLELTLFLQSILGGTQYAGELDFVIIHWRIGVLVVEVKSNDNPRKCDKIRKQLQRGETIVEGILKAIVTMQTQQKAATTETTASDASTEVERETQGHAEEPASKKARTHSRIPVYKVYSAPNNELSNKAGRIYTMDSEDLKNIGSWFNSTFDIRTFDVEEHELLHKLCSVLVGQRTEITTPLLSDELQAQYRKEIDDQSFLTLNSIPGQRNVVSTEDQPDLSILTKQFRFLNSEQLAVWEGPRRQIIHGATGSGKTILLQYKALECALGKLGGTKSVRVYVPIRLKRLYRNFFDDNSVDKKTATIESFPIDKDEFKSRLTDGKCHVFIDEFQLNTNNDLLDYKIPKEAETYCWIVCNKMQTSYDYSPSRDVKINYELIPRARSLKKSLIILTQRGFQHTNLHTSVRSTTHIHDFTHKWYIPHLQVTLPDETPSIAGHNLSGVKVKVYLLELRNTSTGDLHTIDDGFRSSHEFRSTVEFCETIQCMNETISVSETDTSGISSIDPMFHYICDYDRIGEIIKNEIGEQPRENIAVLCSSMFFSKSVQPLSVAIEKQDIAVCKNICNDSNAVYVGLGYSTHSYQWNTVFAITDSFRYVENYTMFTRAISKLVVIFYDERHEMVVLNSDQDAIILEGDGDDESDIDEDENESPPTSKLKSCREVLESVRDIELFFRQRGKFTLANEFSLLADKVSENAVNE